MRAAPGAGRARAAPAAPATHHQLYVKIVGAGDPDTKSKGITLAVLQFVHASLPMLARMGVKVKVQRVESDQLARPEVRAALKQRGVLNLPALRTASNTYLGLAEIRQVYTENIREFVAYERQGRDGVEGSAPEDDLERYYGVEMTQERAKADAETEEEGIGEGSDMMSAHRRMNELREKRNAPRAGRAGAPAREPPRGGPRPNNVGAPAPGPGRAARREPPDEISEHILQLSSDIDDGLRERAFAGPGGDSHEDDDGRPDPQDELMEKAYWANQAESN